MPKHYNFAYTLLVLKNLQFFTIKFLIYHKAVHVNNIDNVTAVGLLNGVLTTTGSF